MQAPTLPSVLEYDSGVLGELTRVYGAALRAMLSALLRPPSRYYFRVNTLKVEPGVLLDEMREAGYRVYFDEYFPEALWVPVEGPERLEEHECRVVVDKRAAESVMLGAHVYAPGVISVGESCRAGARVAVYSDSGLLVAEGVLVEGYLSSLRAGRGLVVRVDKPLYRVPSLRDTVWWRRGLIYEQSISSMTVARTLSPRPGSVIVDLCAAPGGKTGHVYELTGGGARVVAVDHSRRKTARLREEMQRLGHRVEVLRLDARRAPEVLGRGIADYAVLDPPCSSLGVIPKVYDRKTWRDIVSAARYQRQLLRAAAELLKSGGLMVYSTCTMTIVENEENIGYALEKLGLRLVEAWPRRWSRGLEGFTEAQRVHPHVHGATGYFIALLAKP